MTFHDPIHRVAERLEASLDAQALAAQHIAALETVPLLTDFPFAVNEAAQLLPRVRWFANNGNAGMLGRNGLGPQIDQLVKSAGRHGFNWSAQA